MSSVDRGDLLDRVRELAGSVPRLAKLLVRLSRDQRVPPRTKLLFAAIGIYLLVPLDVVPDWIPGLGQLDDALLLAVALDLMLNRVPEEVVLEHWDGDAAVLQSLRKALSAVTMLVPARVKRWMTISDAGS